VTGNGSMSRRSSGVVNMSSVAKRPLGGRVVTAYEEKMKHDDREKVLLARAAWRSSLPTRARNGRRRCNWVLGPFHFGPVRNFLLPS